MPEQMKTRRASRYDAAIATLVGLCALCVSAYTAYAQHHHRDPSLPESVSDQFPAVVGDVPITYTAVRHIAIQELDGNAVDWMEKVSDEQYQEVISDE